MSAAVLERSRALLSQGRTSEAVRLLEESVSAGAAPSVHAMLGYALYHDQRIGDAIASLARSVDVFPSDAPLHEALARMHWMNGNTESFADRFIAAAKANPDNLLLALRCAELLRPAGMTGAAEELLRAGLARKPGQPVFLGTLGMLLDEAGRLEEALETNAAALRVSPGPGANLNLAHTMLRLGRTDEARRLIDQVRRQEPELQIAITYEAMALKQAGDAQHDWLCDYGRHVQVYDLEAPAGYSGIAAFNAELAAILRGLMDAPDHPLEQSLRGGSQTSGNLVRRDDPVLQHYLKALAAPIQAYVDALGDDRDHPMERRKTRGQRLSGCWSVLLRAGGFHVNHTHPDGWISSSYYVSLPASVNEQSQEGWIKFGEPRWPTPGCEIERVVQPREGRLVLFPSYMWHGTIPFSSGERLTAPFDVVPVQER